MLRFPIFLSALYLATVGALATPVADSPDSSLITHTGRGSWFVPGLGACGFVDNNSSRIIGLSPAEFTSADFCNRWICVTANGQSTLAQVRDECASCTAFDLNLSPVVFETFAPLDAGIIPQVSWHFEAVGFTPGSDFSCT